MIIRGTPECPLALTSLEYVPPKDPPSFGCQWAEEVDYPGVVATMALPADENSYLRADLTADAICCGDRLSCYWGEVAGGYRVKQQVFRAPTLEAAEARARAWYAEGAAVISGIVSARRARLLQRQATLAAAIARPGTIVVPG